MAARRQRKKEAEEQNQKSYFDVLGICCPSEVPLIENILRSMDGIKHFSIIVPSRTVIVVHDTLLLSQFQIAKALNDVGLEASVRPYGVTSFKKKWPSPFTLVSGLLLGLSFFKYIFPPLQWLAIGAVAAGIYPISVRAFASVRRFRLDINILAIIAVIGTIAMSDYTEAASIVFLFSVAEWLETRASHKASATMFSLTSLTPQKAVIAETGEEVNVDEVERYTVLAVKAGETIPIDGIVLDGNCEVDEKTLTGEAFPVPKQKDSNVWAGTISLNGYIIFKTTSLAEDCVVAKMSKLVEDAQNSKTKTQRFIEKCSLYYTPAVVIASACFAIVPAALRLPNLKHWFHLALVVLVSACPCSLILSTPVATFCALTRAATQGLLIKGGDYLELLSKIRVTAFDKTGTITRGEFAVKDFQSLSQDTSVHTLLYWVSSIESKSNHPMAAALVNHAKSTSIQPNPDAVEDYQNFPGEGIYGRIDGTEVFIGNRKIASRAGCLTAPKLGDFSQQGKTRGFVFCGTKLVGIFSLSDACRSGVIQGVKELKSLGIKVAMLTGDNRDAAIQAQTELGNELEIIHAELLPEDKAKIITQFKNEIGPTAMVGDGINDAPALATADIGISLGISGSALAMDTGHVILMSNDIRKIPKALKLARETSRKIMVNVFLSISIKGAIICLAFLGHPLVWAAVLADVGSCLLVILNSLLLLHERHKPSGKCYRVSSTLSKHESGCHGDSACHSISCHADEGRGNSCEHDCCGDKNKQQVDHNKCNHIDDAREIDQFVKVSGVCKSRCCSNGEHLKKRQNVTSRCCHHNNPDQEPRLSVKANQSCNVSCCRESQTQESKQIMGQSNCLQPLHQEKGITIQNVHDHKAGNCSIKKPQEREHSMQQTGGSKLDPETGIQVPEKRDICISGCCGNKSHHPMISITNQRNVEWAVDLEKGRDFKSNICQQAKEVKATQGCTVGPIESTISLDEEKNGGNHSSCCKATHHAKERGVGVAEEEDVK